MPNENIQQNRSAYWRAVTSSMATEYELKRQGQTLDWETIEVLCENNGLLRRNVPKPENMSRAASRFFSPQEN